MEVSFSYKMNTRQDTGEPPLKRLKPDGSVEDSVNFLNTESGTLATSSFNMSTIPTPVSLDLTDISGICKYKNFFQTLKKQPLKQLIQVK